MIYNTERAGRSAYYERPAKERKRAKESLRNLTKFEEEEQ